MNRLYPALITCILFSACGPMVSYVGSTHEATTRVDVFVDHAFVKKPYTVIGKGYLNIPTGTAFYNSYEKMQRSAILQAKKHGADAVLFLDQLVVSSQTGISTVNTYDTAHLKTSSATTIGPVVHSQQQILFLRYE